MRIALLVLVAVLLAAGVAMARQHLRYLDARRHAALDGQPLLHGSRVFHVVTFLLAAPGTDVVEAVRALRVDLAGLEDVRWVYGGRVASMGRVSSQIGPVEWSAVTLLQLPSRSRYDELARSELWRRAFARFERSYSHGFERSAAFNLLLPQLLLARRVQQLLTGAPSHFPFEPMPGSESVAELSALQGKLRAHADLGERAAVVVNLVKHGTPEQRAKDRRYVSQMMGAMAEGGYGPLHLGRAVPLEGDADFDQVAVVYYPGVEFFARMAGSRFFQDIVGDKQLGDTQAAITVPIPLARAPGPR